MVPGGSSQRLVPLGALRWGNSKTALVESAPLARPQGHKGGARVVAVTVDRPVDRPVVLVSERCMIKVVIIVLSGIIMTAFFFFLIACFTS